MINFAKLINFFDVSILISSKTFSASCWDNFKTVSIPNFWNDLLVSFLIPQIRSKLSFFSQIPLQLSSQGHKLQCLHFSGLVVSISFSIKCSYFFFCIKTNSETFSNSILSFFISLRTILKFFDLMPWIFSNRSA